MRADYSEMPMEDLVDMLAEETQKFTHMLTYKHYGKEYEDSKKKIHKITAAIEDINKRSKQKKRYNNSDPSS